MKLSEILSHLLRFAEEHPDEKQSTRLKNCLAIDIMVDRGPTGFTHLQMYRTNVYPSREEWSTVLRHWPSPVKVEPRQVHWSNRYYLIARWPTQQLLTLPGFDVCAQTQDGEQ